MAENEIPYGYCHCGCGQPTRIATETSRGDGRIKGQPMRFIHGHNAQGNTAERFWKKVNKRSPDDCWEWTGAASAKGRGVIGIGHKNHLANRLSWILHFGPIPNGMNVLHKCDNPRCVNPEHLFLGTQGDNMIDKKNKGRSPKGEWHCAAKLTAQDVIAIRERYAEGNISQAKLAAEYNVSRGGIADIVKRRNWRHVP